MSDFNPHSLEPFWDSWYIDSFIGEGSFGAVYKIYREEFGTRHYSALKIISIPKSEAEEKQAFYDGMDEKSATQYFRDIVEVVYKEIAIMSELKGKTNIISYEDHKIIQKDKGVGFLILIRMELLESLNDYLLHIPLTNEIVINMGKDLCKALILCQKRNLIHRDIKPANIFVSMDGDFKLGDFGIARHLEGVQDGLSIKGTYSYMAPEVYLGNNYDERVDIYSLGMVLYYFLNNKKPPFLNTDSTAQKYNERQESQKRRFSGEKLPAPANASGELAEVVLKACEFNPQERYSSADEFLKALETVAAPKEKTIIQNTSDLSTASDVNESTMIEDDHTVLINDERTILMDEPTVYMSNQNNLPQEPGTINTSAKKKGPLVVILAVLLLVIAAAGCTVWLLSNNSSKNASNENQDLIDDDSSKSNLNNDDDKLPIAEVTDAASVITPTPTQAAVIEPVIINQSGQKLKDISSIDNLSKVTELDISMNTVESLEPLKDSTYLNYLNMESNKVSDITYLSNKEYLTYLNAKDNQISDLSPIIKLTSLEVLILSNNKINDIEALSDLTTLTNLQLDGNKELSNISMLGSMHDLLTLSLAGTSITDVTPLAGLTDINYLDLSNTGISDITPLSELKEMTYLDLSNSKITDISPLFLLDKLTDLYLVNTDVKDEQIEYLTSLYGCKVYK